MTRHRRPDDHRLWALVTATVRPRPGRIPVALPPAEAPPTERPVRHKTKPDRSHSGDKGLLAPRAKALSAKTVLPSAKPLFDIEPNRRRRIGNHREPIGARLDLHGLDQISARAAVRAFVLSAVHQGHRAVLIITGKGATGEGVLRRATPDWLAEPDIRPFVAGVAAADRHHGGEGALYVALKRKDRV